MKGFTLIELVLSIACIGIVFTMSMPVLQNFITRNDRSVTTQRIASMLRQASNYSRSGKNDSQWGVRISSTSAVLFKGTSYAARDATYDETSTVPGGLALGGLTEVTFTKLYGAPNTTGTVTVTSNNHTETITLNAKGLITY